MNTRPHLHYHTDCDFFGGCENMIANFLNDERIHSHFDVTFSYRKSERYEAGLRNRIGASGRGECYPILAGNVLTKCADGMSKPVRMIVLGLNYLLLLRYGVLAWNILVLYFAWRRRGIDLLHINNGGYPAQSSCLAAAIAARLIGIKRVVMVVNNIAVTNRYRHWWLERPLDYLVARSVTLFVTGSKTASGALQAVLNLPDSQLITLHNGIAARQISESRPQTRARLDLGESDLAFGIVALLEWRKGHRVLLQAMSILREKLGPENMPFLLIEGEGPEHGALKEMIEQLKIEQWVRLVGVEHNVFNFMQGLDVMVLSSIANEDFPNVVLEAMSLGKPVIASRIAGTPEQIEDGVTGWLVEPGDSLALALKMEAIINDRDCIERIGAKAHVRFEESFTAEAAVTRYLNLYEMLNRRMN